MSERVPKYVLDLGEWVTNVHEAIDVKTHELREWGIRWILSPAFLAIVIVCLALMTLDALKIIAPLREAWVTIIGIVLGGSVIGSTVGVGFGWLYGRKLVRQTLIYLFCSRRINQKQVQTIYHFDAS